MNLKKRLRHLAQKSGELRRFGTTTMLAKVCNELQGTMIGANHEHARELQHTHKVVAKSYDVNLSGHSGPFIFDHFAIEQIFLRAADKIASLEDEIEQLNKKLANYERPLHTKKQFEDLIDAPDAHVQFDFDEE